jgi:hypothetical protein
MIFMSHKRPLGDVLGRTIGEAQGVEDIGVGCQGGEVPVWIVGIPSELVADE